MNNTKYSLMLLVVPILILGCSDRMAGCYSLEKGGSPEIRISKRDGSYYATIPETAGRSENFALHTVPEKNFIEFFGDRASDIEVGVVARDAAFGLVRVKSNSKIQGKDPSSDYLLFWSMGSGAVFKMACD